MSHLVISSATQAFSMNVMSFTAPIYESVSSVQTRRMAIHFPIAAKITQPDITFDVIFSSEPKFEIFQRFVRNHQQSAVNTSSLLTLDWPERNINNWTGTITSFQGGGARRNYAPRATFKVDLITSMVSNRAEFGSFGMPWQSIYGAIGLADAVLQPPTITAENEGTLQLWQDFGRGNFPTI